MEKKIDFESSNTEELIDGPMKISVVPAKKIRLPESVIAFSVQASIL